MNGNETRPELRETVLSHLMPDDLPCDAVVLGELEADEADGRARLALLRHPRRPREGCPAQRR